MSRLPRRSRRVALGTALMLTALALGPLVPAHADEAPAPRPAGGNVASGPTIRPNVDGLRASGTMRGLSATLPTAVSLERYTVPVGNQKQVSSCTTWAIGYSMLGWYSMRSGSTRTYAPMYLYSQIKIGKDGGSSSEAAYDVLQKQGIAPRSSYSHSDYDYTHTPSAADRAAAASHKVTAPHYLFNDYGAQPGTAGRIAIETAIAAQHPVALAIPIFRPFYDLNAKHSVLHGSAIHQGTAYYGDHLVLIVGYDAKGVRIQNQWGTRWGDEGFATLDWSFVQRYASQASWIYGFASSLPATVPAQVDQFSTDVTTYGTNGASVTATWNGTGDYDDSARHPVTGYVAKLTGSDGTVQTDTSTAPDWWTSFSSLDASVTYTLTVAATNAIGTGRVQRYSFRPSDIGPDTHHQTDPVTAPPSPSPRMPAAGRPPATAPATPVTAWPDFSVRRLDLRWSAPKYTGHRTLTRYRVVVIGKRHGKTAYRHTFLVPASRHSLHIAYKTRTKRTSGYLTTKLTTYRISVQAGNSAGKWSAPAATLTQTRWYSGGGLSTMSQEL